MKHQEVNEKLFSMMALALSELKIWRTNPIGAMLMAIERGEVKAVSAELATPLTTGGNISHRLPSWVACLSAAPLNHVSESSQGFSPANLVGLLPSQMRGLSIKSSLRFSEFLWLSQGLQKAIRAPTIVARPQRGAERQT
jgi:hypothetical protein